MGCALNGQFQDAEAHLQEVVSFGRKFGCEQLTTPANSTLGLVLIATGRMSEGLRMAEAGQRACLENKRKPLYGVLECTLGEVYLQIVEKTAPVNLATMAKNVGFILKNIPSAAKKAEEHFNKAIEVAQEIRAKGTLGQAYFDLGRLHKAKGKSDRARECLIDAIKILEECKSEAFLKQAKGALASLG